MAPIFISRKKFEVEVSRRAAAACDHIIAEMGAEIHDDLIQKLSVFQFYLDRLERAVHDPAETEKLLLNMRTDFEGVTQSVRRISRRLMHVRMEDDTFDTNLEMLCQNMSVPGTGNVHFEQSGTRQALPELVQSHLYRIVQELIHNAFKHSAAWHIWVRMTWGTRELTLEIEDDGTGFQKMSEFTELLKKKYNTLKMRSLAIGATLSYHQGPKGLLTRVSYPL